MTTLLNRVLGALSAGRAARALVLIVCLLLPLVMAGNQLFQVKLIMLYGIAAIAMYICMEVAGEFMVGHLLVVAVAAYATAWFNIRGGVPVWWTLPLAVAAGAVAVLLLGLPGIRLSGFYLALVSFFAVLVIPDITRITRDVTGGEFGLTGIGELTLFGMPLSSTDLYYLCLIVVAGSYLFARTIMRTTWGTRLMALRDAPQALQAAGVPVNSTKVIAYLLSSIPASLAGWLLVFVNGVVFPGLFSMGLLIVLLGAVVAAGRSAVGAVLVGTAIFAGYGQFVGPFSQWNQLGLGVVLLLVIVIAPAGIAALIRGRRRGPTADDAPQLFRDDPDGGPPQRLDSAATVAQPPVLVVDGVSKSFGGNKALTDVSCEFHAGRVVGLVGANGSGKTTLVNVMTGFLTADAGVVRLGDSPPAGASPAAIARRGLTRTFQIPQLVDDLSVRRNIEVGLLHSEADPVRTIFLGPRTAAAARRRRDRELQVVLDTLHLNPVLFDRPAGSLPLGLKRVVEIARALATGARILCLDEPAAGLDEAEIEALGRALRDVAASGRAVVLIEHHMKFVLEVCDDVLVLDRGRVQSWVPGLAELEELPDALRSHTGLEALR